MKDFEIILANIASKCAINYSAMGAAGFLYESVKDELKWAKLRKKFYIRTILRIGELVTMDEEQYKKAIVERGEMSDNEIAKVLKTAFLAKAKE